MLKLLDGMPLYHGSYCGISSPDLEKCAPYKDFGVISTFKYQADSSLRIKTYDDADAQWLHCIVAHRKDKLFPNVMEELKKFDIGIVDGYVEGFAT